MGLEILNQKNFEVEASFMDFINKSEVAMESFQLANYFECATKAIIMVISIKAIIKAAIMTTQPFWQHFRKEIFAP